MSESTYIEALRFVRQNSQRKVARQMAMDTELMESTLKHLQQVRERLEQHELALRMQNEN